MSTGVSASMQFRVRKVQPAASVLSLLCTRCLCKGGNHLLLHQVFRPLPCAPQVLRVRSRAAGAHAAEVLHDGDMVLAVAGQPVASFAAVERALLPAAAPGADQAQVPHGEVRHQRVAATYITPHQSS